MFLTVKFTQIRFWELTFKNLTQNQTNPEKKKKNIFFFGSKLIYIYIDIY